MSCCKYLLKCLKRFYREINIIILTILYFFLIVPILALICIPLMLWRKVISKIAPILRPDLLKILTAPSTLLGAEDLYADDVLTSMVVLEVENPEVNMDAIRNNIKENALYAKCPGTGELLFPELLQTVTEWMGYLFWIPVTNFDLNEHLSLKEFPKGHDIKEELLNFTRKKHWVKGKPLWEFVIVKNAYKPGATKPCSLIYFKMHHLIGDGFCILQLLTRIFGHADAAEKVAKPSDFRKRKSGLAKCLESIVFFFKIGYDQAEMIYDVNLWELPPLTKKKHDNITGSISEDIPLQYFKKAKNQLGVDFTTLMLAMITGGIREKLLMRFEEKEIPKIASIAFPMPLPKREEKLRNYITYGHVNLPVGTSDPIKRLRIIQKSQKRLKTSTIPFTMRIMFQCVGCMPLCIIKFIKAHPITPTFVLTNLLGPAESINIMDSPLLGLLVASNAPIDSPSGFAFMFITYNGNARLTVGALNSQLPTFKDADEMVQLCLNQLDLLNKLGVEHVEGDNVV